MEKVRLTLEKMHCLDDTRWEWGRDEVYLAVFAVY